MEGAWHFNVALMIKMILCSPHQDDSKKIIIKYNGEDIAIDKNIEVESKGCNGWFDNIEVGIFKKKKILICIFNYDGKLYVSFDNKVYLESDLTYSRYYIFTRIKHFSVFYKKKCILNFNYIFKYFDDDPLLISDFLYELISIKKEERQKNLVDIWS